MGHELLVGSWSLHSLMGLRLGMLRWYTAVLLIWAMMSLNQSRARTKQRHSRWNCLCTIVLGRLATRACLTFHHHLFGWWSQSEVQRSGSLQVAIWHSSESSIWVAWGISFVLFWGLQASSAIWRIVGSRYMCCKRGKWCAVHATAVLT